MLGVNAQSACAGADELHVTCQNMTLYALQMLEAVLDVCNKGARIAACGMIRLQQEGQIWHHQSVQCELLWSCADS